MKNRFIIGLIVLVVLSIIGYNIAWFSSSEEIEIKVNKTERINDKEDSKYLVYTDEETFENTDVTFLGKWDSSDIQGKLHSDSTYTVVVYGWRVPFFSMYRNITEIK